MDILAKLKYLTDFFDVNIILVKPRTDIYAHHINILS